MPYQQTLLILYIIQPMGTEFLATADAIYQSEGADGWPFNVPSCSWLSETVPRNSVPCIA